MHAVNKTINYENLIKSTLKEKKSPAIAKNTTDWHIQ